MAGLFNQDLPYTGEDSPSPRSKPPARTTVVAHRKNLGESGK
jgi:hypothetical protein